MKKLFVIFFLLLTSPFSLLPFISKIKAVSIKPIAPFSEEGNPDEAYQFNEIFPLFRYIRPPALEIYENMDRNRAYVDVDICEVGDERDYICKVDAATGEKIDGCEGGNVDVCYRDRGTVTSQVAFTRNSSPNNSCSAKKSTTSSTGIVQGKCKYDTRPSVSKEVKGTDFSKNDTLTFAKIQSGSGIYANQGTDNPITWGTSYLQLNQSDITINQLLVLRRAKQTKATVAQTGQWPLGWVDWGYKDEKMSKTLLEMYDSLPDDVAAAAMGIAESVDDFFLTGGSLTAISDESEAKALVSKRVSDELAKSNPAEWAKDLITVPIYPPSWRQGFIRPSICVWRICCPTLRCPIEMGGSKRGLYYDTSISQAFGGALDNLFLNYQLDEAVKIFKKIATTNPLIRFATSADVPAIPSEIMKRMDAELAGNNCYKYVPWSNWLAFGTHIDYVNPGDFLNPEKTCPDYEIAPDVTKENANAFNASPLSAVINLLWGTAGDKVDEVADITRHLITIPDAMGQSIQELQQPSYDTRDTLAELESVKEYNSEMSNTIDDGADYLKSGQSSIAASSKRLLPYYACDDTMFSSQLSTSIQAYAMGTRIGCFDTTEAPAGKCDGQLFAKLLETSNYQESSTKGQEYFTTFIQPNLTAELMNTYAAAEKETGVPCEVLAGIHFVEAANNPDGSLVSGRKLGTPEPDAGGKVFRSLLETAKYAGDHLNGKVGGSIKDVKSLITALSRYNGGGNSNCQVGYPYPISYAGCPRLFEGEDDPYPTNFLDNKHNTMYLLYCADHTACVPQVFERPGSFTVALNVYNSMTKGGYTPTDLPSPTPTPQPNIPPGTSTDPNPIFMPKSCGPESLSTALGCLPYTRDAFVSTILSFIVGIAGAIALVVMLIATVQFMTASGDAKKLQSAKELFMSALVGLLFLIFSVSLLRIVAGDIIKLPGF